MGAASHWVQSFIWGDENVLVLGNRVAEQHCCYTASGMFTLKGLISCYQNFIS